MGRGVASATSPNIDETFDLADVYFGSQGKPASFLIMIPLFEKLKEDGQGADEAKKRLIEMNLPLVVSIANKYKGKGVPLADLVQEGIFGLARAIDLFDLSKGFQFSTFATFHIRQKVSRAVENQGKAIREPAHVHQALRELQREKLKLHAELGREPTSEELARATGLKIKKIEELIGFDARRIGSLNNLVGEDRRTELQELIADPGKKGDPAAALDEISVDPRILGAINQLSPQQREAIELFYLSPDTEGSLKDVALILGVTESRVRQLLLQASRKLRNLLTQGDKNFLVENPK